MATSSLLGIDAENLPPEHNATGIDRLGPSDASDSGSDSAGAYSGDSDTDRFGTGERRSVEPAAPAEAQDILPDHVEHIGRDTAGDSAGEPQAEPAARRGSPPLTAEDLPGELPDTDTAPDSDSPGPA